MVSAGSIRRRWLGGIGVAVLVMDEGLDRDAAATGPGADIDLEDGRRRRSPCCRYAAIDAGVEAAGCRRLMRRGILAGDQPVERTAERAGQLVEGRQRTAAPALERIAHIGFAETRAHGKGLHVEALARHLELEATFPLVVHDGIFPIFTLTRLVGNFPLTPQPRSYYVLFAVARRIPDQSRSS